MEQYSVGAPGAAAAGATVMYGWRNLPAGSGEGAATDGGGTKATSLPDGLASVLQQAWESSSDKEQQRAGSQHQQSGHATGRDGRGASILEEEVTTPIPVVVSAAAARPQAAAQRPSSVAAAKRKASTHAPAPAGRRKGF